MGAEGTFRAVLRDRTLRRLQLAVLGSTLGRFAFIIALAVWAYEEGGAALVGLTGFIRMAPGAIVAPFAATLVDRYPRDRVMIASDLARAALSAGAAGAIAADLPTVVVLAVVGGISVAATPFEPARAALTPALVERPALLTAANAVSSAVNSCAYFIGPALGGLLLAVSSVEVVFLATALTSILSAALIVLLRPPRQALAGDRGEASGFVADLREGLGVVRRDPGVLTVFGVFGLQTVITGAVGVFVVLLAIDELDAGQDWVGYLNGLMGVGALIGVAVVSRLLARGRLSTGALGGLALWGLPLLLVAASETRAAAVVAMVLTGVGDTAIDVSAVTLLQRVVPEAMLGRVFGLLEAVLIAGLAFGALLAPVLVSLLGFDGALLVVGCSPVLAVLGVRAMRHMDDRAVVDERPRTLLRGIPMFGVLPLPTLDGLALALRPVEVADGATVFEQGDAGDRYYVVDEGEVEVRIDGEAVRTVGAGKGFGEIALLRDVARTASVVARGPVKLLALEREVFLAAVTGHAGATRAADTLVGGYRAVPVPA
jgi:MFS family permease